MRQPLVIWIENGRLLGQVKSLDAMNHLPWNVRWRVAVRFLLRKL